MKLVVLAQTPPPVHGQSLMVDLLVNGLPAYGIEVNHVNLALSSDPADIGRWRWGKLGALLAACFRVYRIRRKLGRTAFYYIPAAARRGALYRDWIAMILCRPIEGSLILHWHAVGLGRWLDLHANFLERAVTKLLLGRADLSLVLSESLASDPFDLAAKNTLVLPNGIPDPGEPPARGPRNPVEPCKLLYLADCSEEKGLFELIDALQVAHARSPGSFHLTVAGRFASPDEDRRFQEAIRPLGSAVRYAGFCGEHTKNALLREADIFCYPTHHPEEAQPLVLLEALAHDLPIVASRWRAIPGLLPAAHTWFVEPGRPTLLAEALRDARSSPRPGGASRRFFLENYTSQHHLAALAAALRTAQHDPTARADEA